MAKAVEALNEQMENLIDIGALLNARTSVQQALMTEIKAGDRFFNNRTDSALIKEKSAWEMAGGGTPYDSAAWPIADYKGELIDFRIGTINEYRRNSGRKISKEQKDSLNNVHPLRRNSSVIFWKKTQ